MKNIETKRLVIRKFTKKNGKGLQEFAAYKESTEFEKFHQWPTDAKSCTNLAKHFSTLDSFKAVCRKDDGHCIGFVAFNGIDEDKCLDMGHGFTPQYSQNDEDIEALSAMIQYAFDTLDIEAVITRNEPEWDYQCAPIIKLGFVKFDDGMRMTRDMWMCKK